MIKQGYYHYSRIKKCVVCGAPCLGKRCRKHFLGKKGYPVSQRRRNQARRKEVK